MLMKTLFQRNLKKNGKFNEKKPLKLNTFAPAHSKLPYNHFVSLQRLLTKIHILINSKKRISRNKNTKLTFPKIVLKKNIFKIVSICEHEFTLKIVQSTT